MLGWDINTVEILCHPEKKWVIRGVGPDIHAISDAFKCYKVATTGFIILTHHLQI